MDCLNASVTDFFRRLSNGELPQKYSVQDYLTGNYTYLAPAPAPSGPSPAAHHAGPGEAFPDCPPRSMSLGDLVSRPPKGIPFYDFQPPMVECPGKDKRDWLRWDGEQAKITGLDAYLLHHRRRMKPCTSFDKLDMDSGENQAFGSTESDYVHFSQDAAQAIADLKNEYM